MTQEEKAKAYDKVREKIAIRFGSNVADEIFSQFEMSEDERIRKQIIVHIKWCEDNGYCAKEEMTRWINWLEKQVSLKDIVDRHKDSWYNEGKIAGMAEGLTDDEKYQQGWHDALEKQGEQKPQRMISAEAKEALYDKPAWSEEDEERLKSCLNILQAKGIMGATETINTKWLKSLKDRVQPNQWKPSKEQIETLEYYMLYLTDCKQKEVLFGLYDQLKKLNSTNNN